MRRRCYQVFSTICLLQAHFMICDLYNNTSLKLEHILKKKKDSLKGGRIVKKSKFFFSFDSIVSQECLYKISGRSDEN